MRLLVLLMMLTVRKWKAARTARGFAVLDHKVSSIRAYAILAQSVLHTQAFVKPSFNISALCCLGALEKARQKAQQQNVLFTYMTNKNTSCAYCKCNNYALVVSV